LIGPSSIVFDVFASSVTALYFLLDFRLVNTIAKITIIAISKNAPAHDPTIIIGNFVAWPDEESKPGSSYPQ